MEHEHFLPIVTVHNILKNIFIPDVEIECFSYATHGNVYFRYISDETDILRGYISIRNLDVITNDDINVESLRCLTSCSIYGNLVIYSAETLVSHLLTRLKYHAPKELLRKG